MHNHARKYKSFNVQIPRHTTFNVHRHTDTHTRPQKRKQIHRKRKRAARFRMKDNFSLLRSLILRTTSIMSFRRLSPLPPRHPCHRIRTPHLLYLLAPFTEPFEMWWLYCIQRTIKAPTDNERTHSTKIAYGRATAK